MKESCAMTEGREKVMQRVVGGLCTMSVVKIRSVAFSNIGQYGRYLPSITVNLSPRRKLMKTLRVVVVEQRKWDIMVTASAHDDREFPTLHEQHHGQAVHGE